MKICSNCLTQGKEKWLYKGSLLIELMLWCMFLFPGLIYSLWRGASKQKVCPKCHTPHMIDVDSPRGKQLKLGLN